MSNERDGFMSDEIPEHLRSSLELVKRAYPEGVPEADYLPLLAALYEYFSDRNLAELTTFWSDRDYHVCLNDVYKAAAGKLDTARVHERLLAAGLKEWEKEEDPPPV